MFILSFIFVQNVYSFYLFPTVVLNKLDSSPKGAFMINGNKKTPDLRLWLWVFCPLNNVRKTIVSLIWMQKSLSSVTPGFEAQSRGRKEGRTRGREHLPLKVLHFPWYLQWALERNYPHADELTHTMWKIWICFGPSESMTFLKNHQTLFLTPLNMCRWAFVFEGWSEHQTVQS